MASAFRAYDCRQQRRVVLKAIEEAGPWRPDHPVVQEFEAWSDLDHPGIVRAHELRVAADGPLPAGMPYLVLEEVVGDNLDRTRPVAGWDGKTLRRLAVEMLSALAHIHRRGWVHRDVKPANVLQSTRGIERARLTDFGLATPCGHKDVPGELSGSFPYAAPECVLGRTLDGRTDLYALGVLLCRLAAGRRWQEPSPEQTLAHYITGRPFPGVIDAIRHLGDETLATVVTRLVSLDKARRPVDADSALRMLNDQASIEERSRIRPSIMNLRLHLDRTRLGRRHAIRVLPDVRDTIQRRLRRWCPGFGVPFVEMNASERSPAEAWLEGVAQLRDELELNQRARRAQSRKSDSLPLMRVGSRWIVDRMGSADRSSPSSVAKAILTSAGVVPVAWYVQVGFDDAYSRSVLENLYRGCQRERGPRRSGGLLLVHEATEATH